MLQVTDYTCGWLLLKITAIAVIFTKWGCQDFNSLFSLLCSWLSFLLSPSSPLYFPHCALQSFLQPPLQNGTSGGSVDILSYLIHPWPLFDISGQRWRPIWNHLPHPTTPDGPWAVNQPDRLRCPENGQIVTPSSSSHVSFRVTFSCLFRFHISFNILWGWTNCLTLISLSSREKKWSSHQGVHSCKWC